MVLGTQYDRMYEKKVNNNIKKVLCKGWPKNRFEFAVCFSLGGDTLLDVGCGGGEMIIALHDKYKKFIGYELSSTRINNAKENCKNLDVLFLQQGFDQSLEIKQSIDTIICLDVIDHMIDVRMAMRNFYSYLNNDGQLIINVPNIARVDQRLRLLFGKFPSTSTKNQGIAKLGNSDMLDGGKLHYFTFSSLIELLKEVGFKEIKKFGIGKYGKLHNLYPEFLSGSISLVCKK